MPAFYQGSTGFRVFLSAAVTETIQVDEGSPAAGKTIGGLNLRRLTGATVIAVRRGGDVELNPGPGFTLRPGDSIVLLGSPGQIDASVEAFAKPGADSPRPDDPSRDAR